MTPAIPPAPQPLPRLVQCASPIPADQLAACTQVAAIDAGRSAAQAAWADVAIGVVGVLGLLVTLWFNRQAWRQAAAADRLTQAALATAERNAASAADQVAIARDTARRQLRAYLSLEPLTLSDLSGPPGASVTLTLPVRNSGQTPVANWHFVWGVRVVQEVADAAMHEAIIARHRSAHPTQYAFGGLETKVMTLPVPLTPAERGAVLSGAASFLLAGEIVYRDLFDDEHRTTFFYTYAPNIPGRLGQLPWHNRIA